MTRKELEAERLKHKLEDEVVSEISSHLAKLGRAFSITDAKEAFSRYGRRVVRVKKGWPDLVTLTASGRFYGIEAKRPVGGELDAPQARCLKKIINNNGLIVIARSVEDVIEAEAHGIRDKDIAEIEKALKKPAKKGFKSKPIDESVGF